jgi:hypothetical protein
MACPFLKQQKTPGKMQPAWPPLSGVHVVRLLLDNFSPPACRRHFHLEQAIFLLLKTKRHTAIHIYCETQYAFQYVSHFLHYF